MRKMKQIQAKKWLWNVYVATECNSQIQGRRIVVTEHRNTSPRKVVTN